MIAAIVVIMIGRKRGRRSAIAARRLARCARRSRAKSTIMIAFFLTMPTSMMMPIMAIPEIAC